MKSLQEIEEAIVKLPAKARRQLVQDIPALLDKLDAEHSQSPENFLVLNDKTLRNKK